MLSFFFSEIFTFFTIFSWKSRVGGETEDEILNNAYDAMYQYYQFIINGVSRLRLFLWFSHVQYIFAQPIFFLANLFSHWKIPFPMGRRDLTMGKPTSGQISDSLN